MKEEFIQESICLSTRPRHYAAEIVSMASREERRAALARVPPDWRALVEVHVRGIFAKRRARAGRRE